MGLTCRQDLEKARLKTSRAQRSLQEFEQKREHLDFMVHRAELERDQVKELADVSADDGDRDRDGV